MNEVSAGLGISLGLVSGALLGSFALPSKRLKAWAWENTWLAYSAWGLVVLPWLLAAFTVPDLLGVLAATPRSTLAWVFLFGAMWGVGSLGFGLSLKLLGLAMGTAIVLGLNNAIGALLPLVLFHPQRLAEPVGWLISGGVAVMLLGLTLCAVAGARRDRLTGKAAAPDPAAPRPSFARALGISIGAAVFASMFNLAVAFAPPLEAAARQAGATATNAPNATWCVSLLAGFLVTLAYCAFLLSRNATWGRFIAPGVAGPSHRGAFLMGAMSFGGVALYGTAVSQLGELGPSIGWPIIQSMAVASGSFWGMATGEWKGATGAPLRTMILGLGLLFAGIALVGRASAI